LYDIYALNLEKTSIWLNILNLMIKFRVMSIFSKKYKLIVFAWLIISNNSFAEVNCISQSQVDIDNIKPITSQKQDKSINPKTSLMKNGKSTKNDTGYLGIFKILIPASLR